LRGPHAPPKKPIRDALQRPEPRERQPAQALADILLQVMLI
jgi:hypothetical protein